MNWHEFMGKFSTYCLIIPLFIIIALKLFKYKHFLALLVYQVLLASYQLISSGMIHASKNLIHDLGIFFNFLDAPLILFFLLYFVNSKPAAHKINFTLVSFIAFETIIIAIFGFSIKSVTIILGPGIAAVLIFSFYLYSKNISTIITNHKSYGKTLINTSILFAYCIYAIIYVFFYLADTPHKADALLVYDLTIVFSTVLLSAGLILEGKRLKNMEEIKRTRRELSEFFKDDKTVDYKNLTALF